MPWHALECAFAQVVIPPLPHTRAHRSCKSDIYPAAHDLHPPAHNHRPGKLPAASKSHYDEAGYFNASWPRPRSLRIPRHPRDSRGAGNPPQFFDAQTLRTSKRLLNQWIVLIDRIDIESENLRLESGFRRIAPVVAHGATKSETGSSQ